jgi:hypothetical protein
VSGRAADLPAYGLKIAADLDFDIASGSLVFVALVTNVRSFNDSSTTRETTRKVRVMVRMISVSQQ